MQTLLELGSWVGISALYLAFAAIQGLAIQSLRRSLSLLPTAAAASIYLPASVLLLCHEAWSLPVRLIPIALGALVLVVAVCRPAAIRPLWQRTIGLRYLASAMALTALVQAGMALATASVTAAPLAAAAALASLTSLRGSLQAG